MDMVDWDIIEMLQKESGISMGRMAQKLGVPESSVADRVKRLAGGILNGGAVAPSRSPDLAISAFLRLLKSGDFRKVSKIAEVRECYRIGEPDIVQTKVMARDVEHLRGCVEKLKSFGDTLTAIVLPRPPS